MGVLPVPASRYAISRRSVLTLCWVMPGKSGMLLIVEIVLLSFRLLYHFCKDTHRLMGIFSLGSTTNRGLRVSYHRGDAGTNPSHQRCCAATASRSGETQGEASPPRSTPLPPLRAWALLYAIYAQERVY